MGRALGIPEWLAMTLFVSGVFAIWLAIALRRTRMQVAITLTRRANPTREEFLHMMAPDVRIATAEFLWDTAIGYLKPKLTPHPEDDLVRDLPIDEGDWSMDWPREFAERHGFHESNLANWPEGWPITLRNFGRWLDSGPQTSN